MHDSLAVRLQVPSTQDDGASGAVEPVPIRDVPPRTRDGRKAEGWCVYGACPRRAAGWPDPHHAMCDRHRVKVQRSQRRWAATNRSALREAGKCQGCRKPSQTYRCPACRIEQGSNLPPTGGDAGVDTKQDQWRQDANGWRRYRGKGQRGAPAASISDDSALQTAAHQLEKGRIALAYAHSPGVAKLGKLSRDSARAAAAAVIAGAVRFCDDVVSKNMAATEWVPTRIAALRARIWEVLGDADEAVGVAEKMLRRAETSRRAAQTQAEIRAGEAAIAKARAGLSVAKLRARLWAVLGEDADAGEVIDLLVAAVTA